MRKTWYVLESGNVADPDECAPDAKGVMRHKDGEAVAMRGDALSSRQIDETKLDPVEERVTKPAKKYKTR